MSAPTAQPRWHGDHAIVSIKLVPYCETSEETDGMFQPGAQLGALCLGANLPEVDGLAIERATLLGKSPRSTQSTTPWKSSALCKRRGNTSVARNGVRVNRGP